MNTEKEMEVFFCFFKHSLGAMLLSTYVLTKPTIKVRDSNRASGIKISHQRENSSRHMPGIVSLEKKRIH